MAEGSMILAKVTICVLRISRRKIYSFFNNIERRQSTSLVFNLNHDLPFSCEAPLPSRAAGSNDVPRTVKTLTLSFDLIVVTALPKKVLSLVTHLVNASI